MTIALTPRPLLAKLTLTILFALFASSSSAQENRIQLRSLDGAMSLNGALIEFQNGTYVIDHDSFGELRIDASDQIICIGDACPKSQPITANRTIAGPTREVATLLSPLLDSYAVSIGARLTVETANESGQVPITLTDPSGAVIATYLIATLPTDRAFTSLAQQSAAMILTDRRMSDQDIADTGATDLRRTEAEQKLAQDALVFVTSQANPIRALSVDEISKIWSGAITNWLALGGNNQPIAFGSALTAPSDRAIFNRRILSQTATSDTQYDSPAALVAATQSNTGTIGIMRRSDMIGTGLKVIAIRETCGLLSHPSDFSIKSDGYVLGQDVYSYTNSALATPELADFARWIASNATNTAIAERNYVNALPARMALQDMGLALIHTAAVEPDFDGAQFGQVMAELRNADRTSVTFRFQEGRATLDQDSLTAINHLSQMISEGQFAGFEILLVGFSDSSGSNTDNTALALSRANAVLAALEQRLPPDIAANVPLTPLSAGELLPLSCNTTAEGRERNRRVETWLRLVKG